MTVGVLLDQELDYTIYTDASKLGWGCYDPQSGKKQGADGQELHINALELKAIKMGIECLCCSLMDCHIRIMTDNTTSVAGINKQGSTKSLECNEIAREIWLMAIDRKWWLSAAHCPGSENVEADQAS